MIQTFISNFGVIYTETKSEGKKILDELNKRQKDKGASEYTAHQNKVKVTTYEKFFKE